MVFLNYQFLIWILGHNVKIYLLYMHVCVYISVYTCECADVHVHVCKYKPEDFGSLKNRVIAEVINILTSNLLCEC